MDETKNGVQGEPWTLIPCTVASKSGISITVYLGSKGGFGENALKYIPKGPATAQLDISDINDPKIVIRPILQS